MSRSFVAPVLAGVAILLSGYEFYGFASVHSVLADFRSFSCAASVVLHGADAYRAAALAVCEHKAAPFGLYSAPAHVVVPAPLPPYALVLFVPFALLSFPVAALLWIGISVVAIVLCIVQMDRLLALPLTYAGWILLLPATVLWLPYGELAPFTLLGALVAVYGLRHQKFAAIATGLALMALEPHLALGAWLSVSIFAPRARGAVALAGGVLLAICFALNAGALAEYLQSVLPLHALSEVPRPTQYSATWIAYASAAAPALALRIGEATYALTLVAGLAAARALQRRWNDSAVLILAPLAAAVIGGTFVHASQVVLAAPFAAVLSLRESGLVRVSAAIACAALAVPWFQGGQQPMVALLGIVLAAGIVFAATSSSMFMFRAAAATAAFVMLLVFTQRHDRALRHAPAFPVAAAPNELASAPWGRYIWREQSAVSVAAWVAKSGSWLGLLLLVGSVSAALTNKEPVRSVGVHEAPTVPKRQGAS